MLWLRSPLEGWCKTYSRPASPGAENLWESYLKLSINGFHNKAHVEEDTEIEDDSG